MVMIYIFLYLAFREMMLRNFTGDVNCEKKIIPYFRKHSIQGTVLGFFLEGNLDISLWSYICAFYVKEHGIGTKGTDVFSNILGFIMLALILLSLILTLSKANQHLKNKKQKELIKAETDKKAEQPKEKAATELKVEKPKERKV